MTIETPEFQGTHLWERLHWAKEKLEPIQSDYRVVWEDPNEPDEPAKVTIPDPNWMACAMQGGILPPVQSYWELKKDEAQPDFKKHTRGYLLHNTKPVGIALAAPDHKPINPDGIPVDPADPVAP